MMWNKKGLVFKVAKNYDWMYSHTTPISALCMEDRIRVYFATRNKVDEKGNYVSISTFIDLDIDNPLKIIEIHSTPLLSLGDYGCFDEFGVMVTDVINNSENTLMYYAGWQRLGGGTAPYQVMLGLGYSIDSGNTFEKPFKGPILGIDTFDHISIGNVAVLKENSSFYRMYYTSLTDWDTKGIKPSYEYRINYAESNDGISWTKKGLTCVDIVNGFGVATPCVLKEGNIYHMWYGYRKRYDEDGSIGKYRIGYSYSFNGIDWIRADEKAGIGLSNMGWDSEMICYPSVIKVKDKYLMFYCGNGFGKDGFGYAECESLSLNE